MIFLMTDRYIGAWEAANRPRTMDYPFTLIQLQGDKDGKGVGKASDRGSRSPATDCTDCTDHVARTRSTRPSTSVSIRVNPCHPWLVGRLRRVYSAG